MEGGQSANNDVVVTLKSTNYKVMSVVKARPGKFQPEPRTGRHQVRPYQDMIIIKTDK